MKSGAGLHPLPAGERKSKRKEVKAMAIDPVCGMEVDEKKAPAQYEYKGKKYYFCAVGCKERFAKDPEQFLHGKKK
jgi:YHS domain-containing protein